MQSIAKEVREDPRRKTTHHQHSAIVQYNTVQYWLIILMKEVISCSEYLIMNSLQVLFDHGACDSATFMFACAYKHRASYREQRKESGGNQYGIENSLFVILVFPVGLFCLTGCLY